MLEGIYPQYKTTSSSSSSSHITSIIVVLEVRRSIVWSRPC